MWSMFPPYRHTPNPLHRSDSTCPPYHRMGCTAPLTRTRSHTLRRYGCAPRRHRQRTRGRRGRTRRWPFGRVVPGSRALRGGWRWNVLWGCAVAWVATCHSRGVPSRDRVKQRDQAAGPNAGLGQDQKIEEHSTDPSRPRCTQLLYVGLAPRLAVPGTSVQCVDLGDSPIR